MVGLPPPGGPEALLCSEQAPCTPALPRAPGPVLSEGTTSWRVIKVAMQTCSCKGQGGGAGAEPRRPRPSALKRHWLLNFLKPGPSCNAGDPASIPGSGKSAGEGIGYPLQYSWASLVAHLVKKPPAMWETWVQSLGWEDSPEKGKATHSSSLAWRIPRTQSMESHRVGHD